MFDRDKATARGRERGHDWLVGEMRSVLAELIAGPGPGLWLWLHWRGRGAVGGQGVAQQSHQDACLKVGQLRSLHSVAVL